jgi:hypothetical protein
MEWSAAHILCALALLLAVISAFVLAVPPLVADARVLPGLGTVAVILLAVAGLVR